MPVPQNFPYYFKEPLISCDSGMQGQASRSETRDISNQIVEG